MRVWKTSSTWLSKRRVLVKYGEKSYSRCTSRRGRNSALNIIRIGLENPVAVYSIRGVNPRRPQSQVGPMRIFEPRPKKSQSASGTGKRQTAMTMIDRVKSEVDDVAVGQ